MIDIMMPFYGDVDHFIAAVESVRRQTDERWRLVVIDDRYPDDRPRRFVEGIADDRVRYVVNERNLGVSGNFKRSVELSEAEYLVIMGCDDILLPDYVARMHTLITAFPDASYFQPGVAVIDSAGARSRPFGDRVKGYYHPSGAKPLTLRGEALAVSLLRGNWTYFPSLCWKRDVVRAHGFREDLSITLDLALQLAVAKGDGVLVVDDPIVFEYRRHTESASSWKGSGLERFREEAKVFGEAARDAKSLGWAKAERVAKTHLSSRLNAVVQIPTALRAGDRSAVTGLLFHAVTDGRVGERPIS